jgi:protein-L-isoaspartate(D-aspartate) O-methyltransferase
MTTENDDPTAEARERLVRRTVEGRGVEDPRVLAALRTVPRHLFVPDGWREDAYDDAALPLSHGQTISQPYIVGLMSEALQLDFDGPRPPKVLEVGTGSGYQAAVLAQMGAEVFSIEIVEPLAESARALLAELGYDRVHVRAGDGYRGWPEEAPFDAVIVTAAPPYVPEPLKQQLREGGRLVIPVGDEDQDLYRYTRRGERFDREHLSAVRFVPMTGEAQGD